MFNSFRSCKTSDNITLCQVPFLRPTLIRCCISPLIKDGCASKSAIIDQIIDSSNFPKIRFEELYDKAGEGGTPSTSISEYYTDGTIPFVKIDDLSNKYLFDSKDHITELG